MGSLTPEELGGGGKSWRMMTYYDLAMGGAAVNGVDCGSLPLVTEKSFQENAVDQAADIAVSYKNVTDLSFTIHAEITAKSAVPTGTVLHLPVSQRHMDWSLFFESGLAPNRQKEMYNTVWELPGDTAGNKITALAVGETYSADFTVNVSPKMDKAALRVTAILQDSSTHRVLAFSQNSNSPYGSTSTAKTNVKQNFAVNPVVSRSGVLTLDLPNCAGTVTLFQLDGRTILSKETGTDLTHFAVPLSGIAKGFYVLQLKTANNQRYSSRILVE